MGFGPHDWYSGVITVLVAFLGVITAWLSLKTSQQEKFKETRDQNITGLYNVLTDAFNVMKQEVAVKDKMYIDKCVELGESRAREVASQGRIRQLEEQLKARDSP